MKDRTLGETMDVIRNYLENASDKVGAYRKNPTGLQDNEMGDDFENPDCDSCPEMGSNNDGKVGHLVKGDIEDEAKVAIKESARLAVYEAYDEGRLSAEERELLIMGLK